MDMQDDQVGQQPEDVVGLIRDQDPLLEMWVEQTKHGLEMDMTLMVGGLLVSGTLVGQRWYLEGMASQFRNAPGGTPGVGAAVAGAIEKVLAEADGPGEREDSGDEDGDGSSEQDVPERFIHLKTSFHSFGEL
jgi:hypothetical protein